jgi:hypothetical protein
MAELVTEEDFHKYNSVEFLHIQQSYNNTTELTALFTIAEDVDPSTA